MKLKWTEADRKRAEKMGWAFLFYDMDTRLTRTIVKTGDTFKTSREAVDWVLEHTDSYYSVDPEYKTCRKAILLCCLGGNAK